MNVTELKDKVISARRNRFLTNCYSFESINLVDSYWETKGSFMYSYNDHGINRLMFFVECYDDLNILLDSIDKGVFYLEHMTRTPDDFVLDSATLQSRLMRLSNNNCSEVLNKQELFQYKNNEPILYANETDASEINSILWETFDTAESHLLSDEELASCIEKKQVTIHRGESIDAILQAEVLPRKFYINQIVNKTDRSVIHSMLLNRLEEYVNQGGKYLYSWVNERNIPSIRFHAKYDMSHDGMWNLLFRINRD